MMRNDEVLAEVVRLQRERAERKGIDADWVIDRLRAEAEDHGEGGTHAGRKREFRQIVRTQAAEVLTPTRSGFARHSTASART